MFKFDKEFRESHPETIGETDYEFDLENYKDWLEKQLVKKNDLLHGVTQRSELLKAFYVYCSGFYLNAEHYADSRIDGFEKAFYSG